MYVLFITAVYFEFNKVFLIFYLEYFDVLYWWLWILLMLRFIQILLLGALLYQFLLSNYSLFRINYVNLHVKLKIKRKTGYN